MRRARGAAPKGSVLGMLRHGGASSTLPAQPPRPGTATHPAWARPRGPSQTQGHLPPRSGLDFDE